MPAKKETEQEIKEPESFYEKLSAIQTNIKAPKNLYNQFGKYYYRNAEGILEAVKPYLAKYNLYLTLNDEIVMLGDRFYVKAIVRIEDVKGGEYKEVVAYAREEGDKKGMDGSQVTGASSSYARKYALNGLFLLDDTKDADTDEYHDQTTAEKKKTEADYKTELKELWNQASNGADGFDDWYGKNVAGGFTVKKYADMKSKLMETINKKGES